MPSDDDELILPGLCDREPQLDRGIPLLPILRPLVFPGHFRTIPVSEDADIALLRAIPAEPQPLLLLFTQRPGANEPHAEGLHPRPEDTLDRVGVLARVIKTSGHRSGHYMVTLQALSRIERLEVTDTSPFLRVFCVPAVAPALDADENRTLLAELRDPVLRFVDLKPELPADAREIVEATPDPGVLADLVASRLEISREKKAALIQAVDIRERVALLLALLNSELECLEAKQRHTSAIQEECQQVWILQGGANAETDRALASGQISEEEAAQIRELAEHGYLILEGLIDPADIDAAVADIRSVHRHPGAFVMTDQKNGLPFRFSGPEDDHFESFFDLYVNFESFRTLCFHPTLLRFLELLFRCRPVAFQQLLFQRSNEHLLHQDTAYVCAEEPLLMVATWIALEDVVEGRGELTYFDRSHLIEPYRFNDGSRRFRDADDDPTAYLDHLKKQCADHGCEQRTFLAKKGDVFLWTADLVHGGNPRTRPIEETRVSCVTHYLAETTEPFWFRNLPDNRKFLPCFEDRARIVSSFYELAKGEGLSQPNFQLPFKPA